MKKLTNSEAAMILMQAYSSCSFTTAFRYMDLEHYAHISDWLPEPITGRQNVVDYYTAKAEAMRQNSGITASELVEIRDALPRTPDTLYLNGRETAPGTRLLNYADVGKTGVLTVQMIGGDMNISLIVPTVNEEGRIVQVHITDAENYVWLPIAEPDMRFLQRDAAETETEG